MNAIVKHSNLTVGYFFCLSFNSELRKDLDIGNIVLGECSYTFGSVVRTVGQVRYLEKMRKLEAFCEVSLKWDRYFGY